MSQTGSYRDELEAELNKTDPNSHASRLLTQEIERLSNGEDEKKDTSPGSHLDLHVDRPQKQSIKIRLPVREHPKYNFVGKLLGPKGSTLKALQDQTGCKMAIMGRGSMREKDKEEELRKQGGKYAHLNEDLHILVENYTEMTDGYQRLAGAMAELKKFLVPQLQDEMYEGGDMGMNGSFRGRGGGGFRGGPPDRGGRGGGGFRGRGNGPAPPPGGRGAPAGRGGPPSRGAPRGAPSGRGAAPARGGGGGGGRGGGPAGSYDSGYSQQAYSSGYGSSYESGGYDDSYGQSYSSGADSQYYDYGPGSSGGAGYDSYSGGYDYGNDSWGTGSGKTSVPSRGGGASRGQSRSHPYTRPSGGTGGY